MPQMKVLDSVASMTIPQVGLTMRPAEAGKFNAKIVAKIKNLVSFDVKKFEELQQQLMDVKTLGFCKTVGSKETILKINMPDIDSQPLLNHEFDTNSSCYTPHAGRAAGRKRGLLGNSCPVQNDPR